MQVILHAGVHETDEDRLIASLIRNRGQLAKAATVVPNPGRYRKAIRILLRNPQDDRALQEARAAVQQAHAKHPEPGRLILSVPSLFGDVADALQRGAFYPGAEARIGAFAAVVPGGAVRLHLGIRNPASFLPAILRKAKAPDMATLLDGGDPAGPRWSHLITRLRAAHPDIPLTVWCNEDTPLIWGPLLRDLAGLDASAAIEDEFALPEELMSAQGRRHFRSYLASHPGLGPTQLRRVIAAFLQKYAKDDAIEEELDATGWTTALVDRLTAQYDADVEVIRQMSGVRALLP